MDLRTAARLVLASTEEPCVNGHFDCAEVEGGSCSGEALALVAASRPGREVPDVDYVAELAEGILAGCGEATRSGIAAHAPTVVCDVVGGHVIHDGPVPGGGRLTWRTDVERREMIPGRAWGFGSSTPADSDPGYRRSMRDAGRGHLLGG